MAKKSFKRNTKKRKNSFGPNNSRTFQSGKGGQYMKQLPQKMGKRQRVCWY